MSSSLLTDSSIVNSTKGFEERKIVEKIPKRNRRDSLRAKLFSDCRSAGQIGEDSFGRAATAKHRTMDRSVVAVVAADVYAGANSDRTLRGFERAGELLRLRVRDAIALQVAP